MKNKLYDNCFKCLVLIILKFFKTFKGKQVQEVIQLLIIPAEGSLVLRAVWNCGERFVLKNFGGFFFFGIRMRYSLF